jgi:hypothetical protein
MVCQSVVGTVSGHLLRSSRSTGERSIDGGIPGDYLVAVHAERFFEKPGIDRLPDCSRDEPAVGHSSPSDIRRDFVRLRLRFISMLTVDSAERKGLGSATGHKRGGTVFGISVAPTPLTCVT